MRPDAVRIDLDERQIRQAANVGVSRQLAALRKRRPGAYGNNNGDAWTQHIEGCGGELAGCIYYGLEWNAYADELRDYGGKKIADGSREVEFRTRIKFENYQLIVHPNDADDRPFVLVVGLMPTYYIQGWMLGREAKRKEWWSDPSGKNRPAYFVPTPELHSPKDLKEFLKLD